jgi:REP element-mobilizing transposase RayT
MPNHVHGVIIIQEASTRATRGSPLRNDLAALGVIIGAFKSTVTRKIRRIEGYEHYQIWQRNYYEHVIRDETDFQRVLVYIETTRKIGKTTRNIVLYRNPIKPTPPFTRPSMVK